VQEGYICKHKKFPGTSMDKWLGTNMSGTRAKFPLKIKTISA
jgi:hypothetical protein